MQRLAIHLLCVPLLLLIGCSNGSRPEGRAVQLGIIERGADAYPVEVTKIEEQKVVEWIQTVGSVSAEKQATLGTEVGGRMAQIHVNVGDRVTKNTLLAQLDDERNRIARDLARAEVESAEVNLENSIREARRQASLFEDKITSEHSIDQAELKEKIDTAQLRAAEARLAAAERDLSDTRIVSPFEGEITAKHIEVGELVQPGAPLFDIINIERVKILIQVSERDVARIRKDQPAEIEVDGYPGIVFHGSVNTLGAEADDQTRTFPVEILVVNNRPQRLLPGFISRARIRGRTFEKAILLPQEVFIQRSGHPVIFVAVSDTVSEKVVELGFTHRGKVLVTKGLNPGDMVVTTGQEALRDGASIRIR